MRSSSPKPPTPFAAPPSAAPARPARGRARRLGVGVAAALVVVALGACSQEVGAAAVVGGERITVDEVHDGTREILAANERLGQPAPSTTEVNRRLVGRAVTDLLLSEVAERRGVSVTDAEVDRLVRESLMGRTEAQFADEMAVTQLVPPSQFRDFARAVVLNDKLIDSIDGDDAAASAQLVAEVSALSEELDVEVSPRFGQWDATQIGVVAPPDDLSTPAGPRIVTGDQLQE